MELLIKIHRPDYQRVEFKEENDVVGCIDYQPAEDCIKLWSFFIFERFRGRGFAFKAIEELKKHLKGNKLWLYVFQDNEIALKVYKKAGFQIIDESNSSLKLIYRMICDNN